MTDVTAAIRRFIVDGGVPLMTGRGVAVRWDMDPVWAKRNIQVKVLFGRTATDEFTVIATVTGDTEYLDSTDRRLNNDLTTMWYALKVEDLDNGEYWFSNAQPVGTAMRKREWLVAKEIVRREYVRFTRLRAGVRGFHLRRRITGQVCTYCTSPETGQITRANCPYCYGTGFVGGYYKPQEMWVEMNPDVKMRRLDPEQGMISGVQKNIKCLAYPVAHPNDYWVSAKTGLAYRFLDGMTTIAQLEEEPLIIGCDVYIEHSDHVIYKFPIPTT